MTELSKKLKKEAETLKNDYSSKATNEETIKRDEIRKHIIKNELKPLVNDFLNDNIPLKDFRYQIDSINKQNNLWGFRGINGLMFFNMIVNTAERVEELDKCKVTLQKTIEEPENLKDAKQKIAKFEDYVRELKEKNIEQGYSKNKAPRPGSILFFLTYFWGIQNRQKWPIYFKSCKEILEQLKLFNPTGNYADDYESFKELYDKLFSFYKSEFNKDTDYYFVEHLLWIKYKEEEEEEEIGVIVEEGREEEEKKETKEQKKSKPWKEYKSNLDLNLEKPFKINHPDIKEKEKLYFPGDMKDQIQKQIRIAIRNGNHIILIGPPGTGKSKLAKQICKYYTGNEENYTMATATSDWSTFDTIGGYRPTKNGEGEILKFSSGIFFKCFQDENNQPLNKWLIIDEINRADIDKAFGSLFSALTGDRITLSFEDENGENIVVRPQRDEDDIKPEPHVYIIPNDWRLIATMNTYDKASLYEMSYAFMRRFAFIPVDIPRKIDDNLMKKYIEECWDLEYDENIAEEIKEIWKIINKTKRKIGPAIIKDMYKYVSQESEEKDYTSAIILYVIPQFEGMMEKDLQNFYNDIKTRVDSNRLKEFIEDFFRVELKENESQT